MRINLTHILQAPLSARVQHKQVCVGQISVVAPQENLLSAFIFTFSARSIQFSLDCGINFWNTSFRTVEKKLIVLL